MHDTVIVLPLNKNAAALAVALHQTEPALYAVARFDARETSATATVTKTHLEDDLADIGDNDRLGAARTSANIVHHRQILDRCWREFHHWRGARVRRVPAASLMLSPAYVEHAGVCLTAANAIDVMKHPVDSWGLTQLHGCQAIMLAGAHCGCRRLRGARASHRDRRALLRGITSATDKLDEDDE